MSAKLSAVRPGRLVLSITDRFAGAATRTGHGLASTLVLTSAVLWVSSLTVARAQGPAPTSAAVATVKGAAVDTARLEAADSEPQNWFTGGRDQDGSYYSPLAAINAGM